MPRYRYMTPALFGRWRRSPEEAIVDAIKAGLAVRDCEDPRLVIWSDGVGLEQEHQSPEGRARP